MESSRYALSPCFSSPGVLLREAGLEEGALSVVSRSFQINSSHFGVSIEKEASPKISFPLSILGSETNSLLPSEIFGMFSLKESLMELTIDSGLCLAAQLPAARLGDCVPKVLIVTKEEIFESLQEGQDQEKKRCAHGARFMFSLSLSSLSFAFCFEETLLKRKVAETE